LTQLDLEAKWAPLLVDWIDRDPNPVQGGAEDSVYTSQHPAYRAANMPIISISELLSLPDFGLDRFRRLAAHVTALPPDARTINVCFASPALLDALESVASKTTRQTYTQMEPKAFAMQRSAGCFPGKAAMEVTLPADRKQMLEAHIQEASQFFRLHTWVTIGTTRFALYSLLHRDGNRVTLVGRTFGTE